MNAMQANTIARSPPALRLRSHRRRQSKTLVRRRASHRQGPQILEAISLRRAGSLLNVVGFYSDDEPRSVPNFDIMTVHKFPSLADRLRIIVTLNDTRQP